MRLSQISKSTVNGYLSSIMGMSASFVGANAQYHFSFVGPRTLEGVLFVGSMAAMFRILVGHATQDADLVKAVTPDDTVQTVPAHPVPDNPDDNVLPR